MKLLHLLAFQHNLSQFPSALENDGPGLDSRKTMAIHTQCFQTFSAPKVHNRDGWHPEKF